MTGAPMPEGADTVVMQEQVRVDGGRVRVGGGHRPGQNVRHAGEDIARGEPVLAPGRVLTAADLGLLASLGMAEIAVRRRPRVAFFSTGDELRSVGQPLGAGDVYDSNRYTLFGMLRRAGVQVSDLGVVPDDPAALESALRQAAAGADAVITSGGVSVGEADHVKGLLGRLGTPYFWKIAMKPGRPLTFGRLGNAWFFGLPGNPVAVMVTFYQFVLPTLHYLASGETYSPFLLQAKCIEPIKKKPGRYEFLRRIMESGEATGLRVSGVGKQGSGILTSMSRGNCFIHLPESCAGVEAGELVSVEPFLGFL
jgi:molybdopterin molybdotransferase